MPSERVQRQIDLPPTFADGRYKVEKLLGEGGKKRVYLAHDDRIPKRRRLLLGRRFPYRNLN